MQEAHTPRYRISVHVDVEDVHEDRDTPGTPMEKGRLVDFDNLNDAAIGRSDDDVVAAFTTPLRVAEEPDHPERYHCQGNREQPEQPRPPAQREEPRGDRTEESDEDERNAFARDAHA